MCVKFIKQRSFISILNLYMEEAVKEVLVCAVIAPSSIIYSESLNPGRRKRKYRVRGRERDQYGGYYLTLEELRLQDPFSFRRYLRMSTHVYGVLMSVFKLFPRLFPI